MWSSGARRSGRSYAWVTAAMLVVLHAGWGCGDDDADPTGPSGPFRLSFHLDASFQGAHGGQIIEMAVIRVLDGTVVAHDDGTVSATQDPSFSLTSGPILQRGETYEVHYWIDSNFGGGTVGVCDPPATDHQWSTEFLSVSNDISFTTSHQPALIEDVCASFP